MWRREQDIGRNTEALVEGARRRQSHSPGASQERRCAIVTAHYRGHIVLRQTCLLEAKCDRGRGSRHGDRYRAVLILRDQVGQQVEFVTGRRAGICLE